MVITLFPTIYEFEVDMLEGVIIAVEQLYHTMMRNVA